MELYTDIDIQIFVENKIHEIVSSKITPCGNNVLNFRCPICGDSKTDKKKSRGNYYKSSNSYYCYNEGCNAKGFNIIMEFTGDDYYDIKKEFLESIDITVTSKPRERKKIELAPKKDFTGFEIPDEWKELNSEQHRQLEKRLVYDAPFAPKNWKLFYNVEKKRIVIPWYVDGKISYYQERATLKSQTIKYIFPKDSTKTIFNFDMINEDIPYIFLLEGAFDAVFVENGICIGGTTLTPLQLELIQNRYPFHEIIIMLDNQNVDSAAYKHILKKCETSKYRYFLWEKSFKEKDVNQYIINNKGKNPFNAKYIEKNSYFKGKLRLKLTFSL